MTVQQYERAWHAKSRSEAACSPSTKNVTTAPSRPHPGKASSEGTDTPKMPRTAPVLGTPVAQSVFPIFAVTSRACKPCINPGDDTKDGGLRRSGCGGGNWHRGGRGRRRGSSRVGNASGQRRQTSAKRNERGAGDDLHQRPRCPGYEVIMENNASFVEKLTLGRNSAASPVHAPPTADFSSEGNRGSPEGASPLAGSKGCPLDS